jgi:hypothetical protein
MAGFMHKRNFLGKCLRAYNYNLNDNYIYGAIKSRHLELISITTRPALFVVEHQFKDEEPPQFFGIFLPEKGKITYYDPRGKRPTIKSHIEFMKRVDKNKSGYESFSLHNHTKLFKNSELYCLAFLGYKLGLEQFKGFADLTEKTPISNMYSVMVMLIQFFRKHECFELHFYLQPVKQAFYDNYYIVMFCE